MWEAAAGLRNAARTAPLVFGVVQYMGTVTPVEGRSMQPTLNANAPMARDAVLIDRLFAQSYERGDVVVLHSPTTPSEMVLKRVIALGGDWVRRRDGDQNFVRVPTGYVWVEGDNERFSNDSNTYGAVPAGLVNARVLCKAWPPREAGMRIVRAEAPKERLILSGGRLRGEAAAQNRGGSWWWRLWPAPK